jgi:hypothetical protein
MNNEENGQWRTDLIMKYDAVVWLSITPQFRMGTVHFFSIFLIARKTNFKSATNALRSFHTTYLQELRNT